MKEVISEVNELFDKIKDYKGLEYVAVDWGQADLVPEVRGTYPIKYPALLIAPEGAEPRTPVKEYMRDEQRYTLRLIDAPGVSCTLGAPARQQDAAMRLYKIAAEIRRAAIEINWRYRGWQRRVREDGAYELALDFVTVVVWE